MTEEKQILHKNILEDKLKNSQLNGIKIEKETITNITWDNCVFSNFYFDINAVIKDSSIVGTHLERLNSSALWKHITFSATTCHLCTFKTDSFIDCEFTKDNIFTNCSFIGISFTNCHFDATRFHDCTFKNILFENCTFSGKYCEIRAYLNKSISFIRCSFNDVEFSNTEFQVRSNLSSTIPKGKNAYSVLFEKPNIIKIKFTKCKTIGLDKENLLSDCSFEYCDMNTEKNNVDSITNTSIKDSKPTPIKTSTNIHEIDDDEDSWYGLYSGYYGQRINNWPKKSYNTESINSYINKEKEKKIAYRFFSNGI